MKIALGQIRVKSNNPKHNFDKMKNFIEDAKAQDVELIIFPELSIPGTYVGSRSLTQAYIDEVLDFNKQITALSNDIHIIFGSYDYEDGLYNASYHAYNREIVSVGYKSNLNLSRFEHHFFKSKKQDFDIEIENDTYTVSLDEYKGNTIFLTSNTYAHDRKQEFYKNSILVSGVGIYNTKDEVFGLWGNSGFDYEGFLAQANNVFEEELLIQDTHHIVEYLNVPTDDILPFILPIIEFFDEEHLSFKPTWLVGVSGGLDSSVSLGLLTLALGEERVHGITMPGDFTRDITLSNAYHLAKKLNVSFEEIPIRHMVEGTIKSLNEVGYEKVEGLSYENIQARLRGHTLMSVASLRNGVVCNNGNKIETALGYATLYGDAIGALSILGDLTKMEVGKLALEINEVFEEEVIPHNLIPIVTEDTITWDFAPSAELSEGQFDPFKWGYHDNLIVYLLSHSIEDVLEMYLDKSIFATSFGKYIKQYKLDDPRLFIDDLEWIIRTLNGAAFKRIQTPPIIRVSKVGFGQENQSVVYQTEKYHTLKNKILA